mmetsp:Transcript_27950/g.79072  ORF Transcript_27950/g.79072 Transcript_27950/m.79072 type:complete len:240 (-) Transcript_27950:56-775(-)
MIRRLTGLPAVSTLLPGKASCPVLPAAVPIGMPAIPASIGVVGRGGGLAANSTTGLSSDFLFTRCSRCSTELLSPRECRFSCPQTVRKNRITSGKNDRYRGLNCRPKKTQDPLPTSALVCGGPASGIGDSGCGLIRPPPSTLLCPGEPVGVLTVNLALEDISASSTRRSAWRTHRRVSKPQANRSANTALLSLCPPKRLTNHGVTAGPPPRLLLVWGENHSCFQARDDHPSAGVGSGVN